jgi:hypothetical protein
MIFRVYSDQATTGVLGPRGGPFPTFQRYVPECALSDVEISQLQSSILNHRLIEHRGIHNDTEERVCHLQHHFLFTAS